MNKVTARYIGLEGDKGQIHFNRAYQINNNNWGYNSDSLVDFDIAYNETHIYLKYFVKEPNVKAVNTMINGPVWEDSCVEFFIAFNQESYYNLEFNCIGNVLGGYGVDRNDRQEIEPVLLDKICTKPSLGTNKIEIIDTETEWALEVAIPFSVFKYDKIESLKGVKAQCNFFKCGDKQVKPHFLSWNPIKSDQPNFHLSDYFGEIRFE